MQASVEMTRATAASRSDSFCASRIPVTRIVSGTALLVLLIAVPSRLEGQCALSGSPVSFEPNPPGAVRPGTLSSGFSNGLVLYQPGGGGPYRLLMQESFGYSVLDLTTPTNPTALIYHDIRYPLGGPNSVRQAGDGQNLVQTIAVSPDGQRAAFSMTGLSATIQTAVGSPNGSGFTLRGDFYPKRSNSTLVQHVGNRHIAYDIHPNVVTASDVSILPGGSLTANNLAYEITTWLGGGRAVLAGNYILYQITGAIRVIDASLPGPSGNITASYPQTSITNADFPGGRTIANFTAAVDPADATKLWVLVELNALTGENSPSYGLLSVTKSGLGKVSAGPTWRVPSQTGDVWLPAGMASALIPNGGDLFVLMWAAKQQPTSQFLLYSTMAAAWASVSPSSFPVSGTTFALPGRTAGFGVTGTSSVYMYVPTTVSAYVIPMSCVSINSPAVTSMTVANQAGAALNSGDSVFLGDEITITPSLRPAPVNQPLTGFGWNFDFDFHAGALSEDNGATVSPRIKAPDNGALANPATPPSLITVVGPCDPQVGGTTPGNGSGCWTSVTTNGAFAGGTSDFTAQSPVAKALTFAFEANNRLGSAGASLFTLNWKVPAAKLQSTQVLSGSPLVSGSDGHPTATGFKWYFGTSPATLTRASCPGSTCVPPPAFDTRGTYYLLAHGLLRERLRDTGLRGKRDGDVHDRRLHAGLHGERQRERPDHGDHQSKPGRGQQLAARQRDLGDVPVQPLPDPLRGQLPGLVRDDRPLVDVRLASVVGDDSDPGDGGDLRSQDQGELHRWDGILAGSGRRQLLPGKRGESPGRDRDRRPLDRGRRSDRHVLVQRDRGPSALFLPMAFTPVVRHPGSDAADVHDHVLHRGERPGLLLRHG